MISTDTTSDTTGFEYGNAHSRLRQWSFGTLSSDVDFHVDEDVLRQHYNMTVRRIGCSSAKLAIIFVIILASQLSLCNAKISDKRLCYDKDCTEVVSLGKTTLPYNSKDGDVLSFPVNTEVKIFSKQAGTRQDLWGVEIKGKRGYAPSKFIREYKVYHSKLEHVIPTEKIQNEKIKIAQKPEETLDSNNSIFKSTQESQEEIKIHLNESNISIGEEKIIPEQISPSFENVYDGTILPQQNEDVEPPPPSYSTQSVNDYKMDEQVRLKVYPDILTSTFSAISGMLSNTEATVEKENIEVSSSEKYFQEEAVQETPAILKTDDSSLDLEKEYNLISETIENNIEGMTTPTPLSAEETESLNYSASHSSDEIKILSSSESNLIKNIENEIISENEFDTNDKIKETTEQNKIQIMNVEENLESSREINNLNKVVEIEDSLPEISTTEDSISSSVDSEIVTITEVINTLHIQNDFVPKEEEAVADNINLNNIKESATAEEVILDIPKVNVNTSDNIVSIQNSITPEVPYNQQIEVAPIESALIENTTEIINDVFDVLSEKSKTDEVIEKQLEINSNVFDENNNLNDDISYTTSLPLHIQNQPDESPISLTQTVDSNQEHTVDVPSSSSFGEFLGNRNLLNAEKDSEEIGTVNVVIDEIQTTVSSEKDENLNSADAKQEEENVSSDEVPPNNNIEKIVLPLETCDKPFDCSSHHAKQHYTADENAVTNVTQIKNNSDTLLYVCLTAVTTLLFSLGYYFIENKRRDGFLIAKINNLEKDLMITRKECIMLDENFKSTKTKLDSIEDESFGSNEMVLSLKDELAASENARLNLEDQISTLEKELESASEAGLELERMLREILSTHGEENNPLAQSIEDLQVRLNEQQVANESLTNALAFKTQENETLSGDLSMNIKKVEELQTEVIRLTEELKDQISTNIHVQQTLSDQVQKLDLQNKTLSDDNSRLSKSLKANELELKELSSILEKINSNDLDLDKVYEVSHIKAEAAYLLEERDELKVKLSEEQGAHELLEEHTRLVSEEVNSLSEQCKIAEKEKKDAETRLEVLTKFFEEKEAQRQKEEALWLEKQGEVSSTVERLQSMQNEILNYKQQIEMLKREILDQEREYKNQISVIETKAHEHWVTARQNERRLEEVKVESSQLRNRLTLVEKNINESDPENKLHRLQASSNGETGNAHALFVGGETSSSPLMFGSGGGLPPLPPPSYLYGPPGGGGMYPPPPPPSFLPPPLPPGVPELASSRPPPLGGGRLSSPPPPPGSNSQVASPPLSPPPPPTLHGFPPHHHHHHQHPLHRHRSPPPLPPFAGPDVPPLPLPPLPLHHHHQHHQPPPPPPTSGVNTHNSNWGDETALPLSRNSSAFLAHQRDQRSRNHKGSLHSSGESLDKIHHGGKV